MTGNLVTKLPIEQLSDTGSYYYDDGSIRFLIAGTEVAKFNESGMSLPTSFTYQINDSFVAKNSQPDINTLTVNVTAGNEPVPDNEVTIADASSPTNVELLEYCRELRQQIGYLISRLKSYGVIVE